MMVQFCVSNGAILNVFREVWMDKYLPGQFQGYEQNYFGRFQNFFIFSPRLNYMIRGRNQFWVAVSLVILTPFGHSLFKMIIFYLVHLMEQLKFGTLKPPK